MDLTRPLQPTYRLFALYLAAAAGASAAGLASGRLVCVLPAAINLGVATVLVRHATRGAGDEHLRRRDLLLPYVLWPFCWLALGWIIRCTGQPYHDRTVAAVDLVVFGGPWHVLLARRMPAAAPLMHAAYLSYYALVLGPPLLLARRGRTDDCARYTCVVMATYLACFACYLVYPVLGPRAAAAGAAADASQGLGAVEALLRALGDSPGTAFPSSHCAGAWAAALAAGALVRKPLRIALVAWAALITLSTIHTGNHYALDAAAGVLTAVAVRGWAVGAGARRRRPLRREVLS